MGESLPFNFRSAWGNVVTSVNRCVMKKMSNWKKKITVSMKKTVLVITPDFEQTGSYNVQYTKDNTSGDRSNLEHHRKDKNSV